MYFKTVHTFTTLYLLKKKLSVRSNGQIGLFNFYIKN